jgi:serine/threonine protein kinase
MEGKTISHYKILDRLGEGGMGVVYKAEDTSLRRIVALKFLRQEVWQDGESKERLLREAQAAAALDHSNIGAICEIDQVAGHTSSLWLSSKARALPKKSTGVRGRCKGR